MVAFSQCCILGKGKRCRDHALCRSSDQAVSEGRDGQAFCTTAVGERVRYIVFQHLRLKVKSDTGDGRSRLGLLG